MKLEIDRRLLTSLLIIGSVVEARDAYTGGHLWRVGQFSRLLAEESGIDKEAVYLAALGGFLHDLGKVGIPDAILNKAGALTEPEYAVIKTHPSIGRDLLGEHPLGPLALDAVAYHHERADGAGYPERLAEDQVPLVARIVAIADAFDAMTSTRPYRRGMPIDRALDILDEEKGRQFDGDLASRFTGLGRAGRLDAIVGHSLHGHRLGVCPKCGPILPLHGLADGARHGCRSCGGAFVLHRRGEGFELEQVGAADADLLKPVADIAPVRDLVAELP